jgi:hypothetical protein
MFGKRVDFLGSGIARLQMAYQQQVYDIVRSCFSHR